MNTNTILIVAVIILACMAIAYFGYRHRHYIQFSKENLKANIGKVFDEAGEKAMPRQDFLMKLKDVCGCTQKQAVMLLGEARKAGLIAVEGKDVRLPE